MQVLRDHRPFFSFLFPFEFVAQHVVRHAELVDVPDAVNEIIVVLSDFLLRALLVPLFRGCPLVPNKVQEILFDVMARTECNEARFVPLVAQFESFVDRVVSCFSVSFLRQCAPNLFPPESV